MKKYFILLFSFFISNVSLLSQFSGGDGTVSNPYQISNREDMEALADSVNSGNNWSKDKYFKVMNDIDDSIRTIIGSNYSDRYNFQGNFDGNNKNITVSINAIYVAGIFGYTDKFSVIENLNVDGQIVGIRNIGGIIGWNNGIVQNCNNYALLEGTEGFVGGIVGLNNGKVIHCNNSGAIYGGTGWCVGGVVGHNDGYVLNCMNAESVEAGYSVGGVVGHNSSGIVEFCINIGTVKGDTYTGGICGEFDPDAITSSCINSGLVIGKHIVGGIIGRCRGEVKNCLNTGTVKGNTKTGCIVGENEGGTIENCYYDKQICSGEE
jgi:hypothetical protein